MHTQIKNVGLANGVKATGKKYSLSDMIQESFRVSYKAKAKGDKTLTKLVESHLARVKKDPTDPHLNGDLEVLAKLATRKAPLNEAKTSKAKKANSWESKSLREGLSNFRKSAKTKVFFKEFEKLRKPMTAGQLTLQESITLYKAVNSCMTHLTVELEKNPNFRKTYTECTAKLASDNARLLEAIQKGVSPDKSLLKSYLGFNKLLHEGNIVAEDPEAEDDVIGYKEPEDELVNECGDNCVGDECPPEEDPGMITEGEDGDPAVDLSPEEIKVLKSILDKISKLDVPMEDDETPALEEPDEPVIPDDEPAEDEVNEDEELAPADEDDDTPVDEDIPEDDPVEEEEPEVTEDPVEDDEVTEDLDIPLDDDDEDLEEDDEVEEPVEAEDAVEDDVTEEPEEELPARLEKLSDELNEVAEELADNEDEEVTYEEDPELSECDENTEVTNEEDEDQPEDLEECDAPEASEEDEDLEECDIPLDDEDDEDDLITEAIKRRIKSCF